MLHQTINTGLTKYKVFTILNRMEGSFSSVDAKARFVFAQMITAEKHF